MEDYYYERFDGFLRGYYICTYNNISKLNLRSYIKKVTDDFDPIAFQLIIEETRNFVYNFDGYFNSEKEAYFKAKNNLHSWFDVNASSDVSPDEAYDPKPINSLSFESSMTLSERIEFIKSNDITIIKEEGFDNILDLSVFLDTLYYNYIVQKRSQIAVGIPSPIIQAPESPIPVLKLHSTLSDACLIAILQELIAKNFIARTKTIQDDWLFWFGRNDDLQNPRKIIWQTKHSILPNFIVHICGSWTLVAIKNAFCAKKFSNPKDTDYINKPLFYRIERIINQFK